MAYLAPTPAGIATATDVLTSNGSGVLPTFQTGGGSGIGTLDGDSGSATGATVTLNANTNCGSTVSFSGSGSTIDLNVSKNIPGFGVNTIIGLASGDPAAVNGNNVGLGWGVLTHITGSTSGNTVIGSAAYSTGIGSGNVVIGVSAMFKNTDNSEANTAIGADALINLVGAGIQNIAIGWEAGQNYTTTESSNILIGSKGVLGESNVTRIGTQGAGTGQQNACYIAGISGVTVTGSAVLCSTSGQLGTVVSSREFKENIKDIADESSAIMNLRPVRFNFISDKDQTTSYGMIAEEVDEIFPELVIYKNHRPYSLKYHEMPALLLNEMKKMEKRIEELEKKLASQ